MEIEKIDLLTNSSIQFLLGLGRHEIESAELDKYFQVTGLMFSYNTLTGFLCVFRRKVHPHDGGAARPTCAREGASLCART